MNLSNPLLICTWFLKNQVVKSSSTSWIFSLQKSISNLIFAGYTGSKNPVWNRQKIQFAKLGVSKLIFQKSSTDQQGERQDHLNVKFIRWHRNLPLFCFCICELQPPGWSVLCPLWQWLEGLFVCIDCSSIWFCLLRSSLFKWFNLRRYFKFAPILQNISEITVPLLCNLR